MGFVAEVTWVCGEGDIGSVAEENEGRNEMRLEGDVKVSFLRRRERGSEKNVAKVSFICMCAKIVVSLQRKL